MRDKYRTCIEACNRCAVECEHCASACLQEDEVKMMARCIDLDRQCAIICRVAAGSWPAVRSLPRTSATFAPRSAVLAAKNAESTEWNIASVAPRRAHVVRKSVNRCQARTFNNETKESYDEK
jgi:uncharacterized protein DUF326